MYFMNFERTPQERRLCFFCSFVFFDRSDKIIMFKDVSLGFRDLHTLICAHIQCTG